MMFSIRDASEIFPHFTRGAEFIPGWRAELLGFLDRVLDDHNAPTSFRGELHTWDIPENSHYIPLNYRNIHDHHK